MDFQKYLKYKTKYLQQKNFLQKGGIKIKLGSNEYDTQKYYSPLEDLTFLADESIDELGFSEKHPDYYFDISIYSVWETKVQYQLKVYELNDSLKLPETCNGKKGILTLSRVQKYMINSDGIVTAPRYHNFFEGYRIKTEPPKSTGGQTYFSFVINKI